MRVSQDMASGWGRQSTAISMLPRTPKSAPTHMLMAAATFTSLRRPAMPLQSHAKENSVHAAQFGARGFFSDRCLHVCWPFRLPLRGGGKPAHYSQADGNVCFPMSCCSLRQGSPALGQLPEAQLPSTRKRQPLQLLREAEAAEGDFILQESRGLNPCSRYDPSKGLGGQPVQRPGA